MTKFKIERGVPISDFYLEQYKRNSRNAGKSLGRNRKYPFRDMEINDSFLVPAGYEPAQFRMIASTYAHRFNMKFLVIRDSEHKLRCYRIA